MRRSFTGYGEKCKGPVGGQSGGKDAEQLPVWGRRVPIRCASRDSFSREAISGRLLPNGLD
jgi:hypothetical protein